MGNDLRVESIDSASYQHDLINFPHSLFITHEWVEAMSGPSSEPVYLKICQANKTIAIIAGLLISGTPLQGRQLYFYSAPALQVNDSLTHQKCLIALKKFARENALSRINIRPWDQQHSYIAEISGFISTQTHEFPIIYNHFKGEEQISSRIRRNIKKGQKTNVQIHQCKSMNTLDTLISLLDATHQRRENKYGNDYSPFYLYNLNRQTIEKLINSGAAIMYCASIDDKVYSVELNLEYNKKAYNILKASIDEAYQNGISSWLDFYMIQHYSNNGYEYFNLGGELQTDDGAGLAMFKQGLGGEKRIKRGYYTYYLSFPRNLMNPIMQMGRLLPDNNVVNKAKQLVSRVLSAAAK